MARPKQTPEHVAATRERILDAAKEILFEEGPEALSIRAIASRLGVSHMTLYTYFENRDALVAALKERQRARIAARQDELLRRAEEGDVLSVVRESLNTYVRMAEERPRVYRLLWLMPRSEANCEAEPGERLSRHLRQLTRLVQIGVERGAFAPRDPTLAAATVFAIVNGPLFLTHTGHLTDVELKDRLVAECLNVAMDYLCGEPSPAPVDERTLMPCAT